MRRIFIAALIAIAAVFAADAGWAGGRNVGYVPQPRIVKVPRVAKVPRIPIIAVIPPSMALNRAMSVAPNSQALGVKLRGPLYIVKLKQGNTIRQVMVNATTGAVSP